MTTVLLTLLFAILPVDEPAVRLLHTGNAGFLVESGDMKVLVDALQGDGLPDYPTLPDEERDELESARASYEGVDLVLATHWHDDHFNAESVSRFLEAAPDAPFVTTRQAAEQLRDAPEDRVTGLDPDDIRPVPTDVGLRPLDIHHGRDDVQNLGFVFDVGGLRFLHVGDAMLDAEEWAALDLPALEIDVAFMPYWHIDSVEWPDIREALGARLVVVMHLPGADAPPNYFGHGVGSRDGYVEWLGRERPDCLVFWEPLQERELRADELPER